MRSVGGHALAPERIGPGIGGDRDSIADRTAA